MVRVDNSELQLRLRGSPGFKVSVFDVAIEASSLCVRLLLWSGHPLRAEDGAMIRSKIYGIEDEPNKSFQKPRFK